MLSDKRLSAEQAFEVADAMQAAAAASLLLRRTLKDTLSDGEYAALIEKETALRYDADRYRAVGITLLASNGSLTTQGLVDAIDHATEAIKKISDIRHAINILNRVATLAVTIASGNTQAILTQISELKATVKANA